MTSVAAACSASTLGVIAHERLRLLGEERQHREQTRRHERRHERVAGSRDQRSIRNRRQRGDEARQHPQAEEQRHADVADQIDLQALQLFDAQRSRDDRGDREHADRCQGHDKARRLRDGLSGRGEHVEQGCLVRDADERRADDDAEQHDRRNDVVGERIERIGRNVEVQEVERLTFLEQRRAEERRVLIGREHQREQQDRGERDRPEDRQDEPHSLPERPRLRGIEGTEPADDRHRHVRQDRHLQQLDVGVGDDLQRRRPLADEQPQRRAAGDADGDPGRRREAPLRRALPASSLATVSSTYQGMRYRAMSAVTSSSPPAAIARSTSARHWSSGDWSEARHLPDRSPRRPCP